MNVYTISRNTQNGHYDEAYGFVVVAESGRKVRKIVVESGQIGDEGSDTWLDPNKSKIRWVGYARSGVSRGIIMTDFLNG